MAPPRIIGDVDATGEGSDRASRRNGGKVLLGIEHVIEEVRQGVHGHQRDDLHDVRIRVAAVLEWLAALPARLDAEAAGRGATGWAALLDEDLGSALAPGGDGNLPEAQALSPVEE